MQNRDIFLRDEIKFLNEKYLLHITGNGLLKVFVKILPKSISENKLECKQKSLKNGRMNAKDLNQNLTIIFYEI